MDELTQRLFGIFVEELKEQARAFDGELLELERQVDESARSESLRTLFRIAHSLKGAARSVGLVSLEGVCHQLEEVLAELRAGSRPFTPSLFALLFECVDALLLVGNALAEDPEAHPAPLVAPILAGLAQALAQPPASAPRSVLPSLPPPRVSVSPASGARSSLPPAFDVSNTVRVPGSRLDALMTQSGELLVARRRLDARPDQLAALRELVARGRSGLAGAGRSSRRKTRRRSPANGGSLQGTATRAQGPAPPLEAVVEEARELFERLEAGLESLTATCAADRHAIERAAAPLDAQIRHARMLPFAIACEGLARVVRDLSSAQSKDVDFTVTGGATELDRSLVDGLRGPLLQLVRNAIDHGVETPEDRAAGRKPRRAQVAVSASVRGDLVVVSVRDTGRGIDWERVRSQATASNIALAELDREPWSLLFLPGFSTSTAITEVSGRGVGLDIVRTELERLRGTIEVASKPDWGTCFTLTLPLTLSSVRAVFVRAGAEVLALPASSVRRLVRVDRSSLRSVLGKESIVLGDAPIPVAGLAQTLGLEPRLEQSDKLSLLVLGLGKTLIAFVVDEFLAEQDVVLKPLGARLQGLRFLSGVAVLPTGKVALLLNPTALLELMRGGLHSAAGAAFSPASSEKKRLIVADDSITTRSVEQCMLEAAGYEVLAAADGSLAWELLQERGAHAIVTDVEMPKMDGLALTRAIRGSKRFQKLPVILLTACETEQDRSLGLEAGADAYLQKSDFDQQVLLATIAQLV